MSDFEITSNDVVSYQQKRAWTEDEIRANLKCSKNDLVELRAHIQERMEEHHLLGQSLSSHKSKRELNRVLTRVSAQLIKEERFPSVTMDSWQVGNGYQTLKFLAQSVNTNYKRRVSPSRADTEELETLSGSALRGGEGINCNCNTVVTSSKPPVDNIILIRITRESLFIIKRIPRPDVAGLDITTDLTADFQSLMDYARSRILLRQGHDMLRWHDPASDKFMNIHEYDDFRYALWYYCAHSKAIHLDFEVVQIPTSQ